MLSCNGVACCYDYMLFLDNRPFCLKINRLLCSMLKIDPRERIPFHRFFDFVDDIITSKIEVINILQGTSLKIVSDSSVR